MNIQTLSSYPTKQQAFNGKLPKELMEIVPNTRVSKNLTRFDQCCFKSYVNSIPYRIGVLPKEIKEIEHYEGENFVNACQNLILKKMGIPKEVRPALYPVNEIAGDAQMQYIVNNNIIVCDKTKISKATKPEIFGLIRHECQHYIQNTSILRHEEFGDKAITKMTESYINNEKETSTKLFTNYTDEQLQEIFINSPDALKLINQAKELYTKGDIEGFNKLFESVGKNYKKELIQFQTNLKNTMGSIPKDSPLTPKIARHFDELYNINYYDKNSKINCAIYLNQAIEQEAINAQAAGMSEFDYKSCPIRLIKKEIESYFNDENFVAQ